MNRTGKHLWSISLLAGLGCSAFSEAPPKAASPQAQEPNAPPPEWTRRGVFFGELDGEKAWFTVVDAPLKTRQGLNCAGTFREVMSDRARAKYAKTRAIEQKAERGGLTTRSAATLTDVLVEEVAGYVQVQPPRVLGLYRIKSFRKTETPSTPPIPIASVSRDESLFMAIERWRYVCPSVGSTEKLQPTDDAEGPVAHDGAGPRPNWVADGDRFVLRKHEDAAALFAVSSAPVEDCRVREALSELRKAAGRRRVVDEYVQAGGESRTLEARVRKWESMTLWFDAGNTVLYELFRVRVNRPLEGEPLAPPEYDRDTDAVQDWLEKNCVSLVLGARGN